MGEERVSYFLDSSAVVKLYHDEGGSEVMEALTADASAELWVSDLARIEVHSAFLRKVRDGELVEEALSSVFSCFSDDLRDRFLGVSLTNDLLESAITLLRDYGLLHPLRTLDALQLAAARRVEGGAVTFVTADEKLLRVARLIFPQTPNPEETTSQIS